MGFGPSNDSESGPPSLLMKSASEGDMLGSVAAIRRPTPHMRV